LPVNISQVLDFEDANSGTVSSAIVVGLPGLLAACCGGICAIAEGGFPIGDIGAIPTDSFP
jgi:hypothetical protein